MEKQREREEQLFHEISMLSKMRHPNIIQFVGACVDPIFIVMEFMPLGKFHFRFFFAFRFFRFSVFRVFTFRHFALVR